MNIIATAVALGLVLGGGCLPQTAGASAVQSPAQPPTQSSHPAPSVQQIPVAPVGASNAVQITNGPVVEHVTDTTAEIAWSTNVNSGTVLRYGTDPSHLDQNAGMPWGGLTHRITLKDLKPNTTYYFKAESGQGQGTGSHAETAQASFQTKPAGSAEKIR
jgi:hypothetical protein